MNVFCQHCLKTIIFMSLFQVDQDNSTLGAIQQNLDRFRTLKLKSKMEIMTFLNDASFLVQEIIHILRKHIFRIFEPPSPLQGVSSGFDIMYLVLVDRNMQVRFSLKVVWES